jgi:hypothetical protein
MIAAARRILPISAILLLCSCGGGGGGGASVPQPVISTGLKIFATNRTHAADFLHDASLVGATAIEKADNFCQTDAGRPDANTYKAILVDGVSRDALVPLDWVLKPNTDYYQVDNNVLIGTTTSAALFGGNLDADIHDSFGVSGGNNSNTSTAWTGFADGVSFTTGSLTCDGWTYGINDGTYAPYGVSYGTDGTEWYTNGGQVCSLPSHLYCAEQ